MKTKSLLAVFFVFFAVNIFSGCAGTRSGPAAPAHPLSEVPPSPYLTGALPAPAECADGKCAEGTLAPPPPPALVAPTSDLEARVTALETWRPTVDSRLDSLESLVAAIGKDLAASKAKRAVARKKCAKGGCSTATRLELAKPGKKCWLLSPFEAGVTSLSDRQKKQADALLTYAEKKEITPEEIAVYSDPQKPKAEADAEAEKRASALKDYFKEKGVEVEVSYKGRPGIPALSNIAGVTGTW
ncbi:MAG: hypothetical protein WC745_02055 [Patescibacteria group bacterium]